MDALTCFWLVILFLLGLCTGSFLNVVIYRLPRGESITFDRSHCPSCGKQLVWYDLIPVLSYLLLLGRCRSCHTRISIKYPIVELLTGIIFIVLFHHFGATLVFLKYLFLSALLVAVSFIDLEHYIIPNSLVITGLVGGVVLNLAARDVGVVSALIGIFVTSGFLLLIALISKGGMGEDIKLAAVTGLFWVGRWHLLVFWACAGGSGDFPAVVSYQRKKGSTALWALHCCGNIFCFPVRL